MKIEEVNITFAYIDTGTERVKGFITDVLFEEWKVKHREES